MVARMRASISVLGPLIARLGQAHVAMPGGCNIGSRKIDMHIRGLEGLGVEITIGPRLHPRGRASRPQGHSRRRSTSRAWVRPRTCSWPPCWPRGRPSIENAAREPEIQDLAEFLIAMGARIDGVGSPS